MVFILFFYFFYFIVLWLYCRRLVFFRCVPHGRTNFSIFLINWVAVAVAKCSPTFN